MSDHSEGIRINKYLSQIGFCSRREADELLLNSAVVFEGRCLKPGDRVPEGAEILVNGRPVSVESDKILLLFYKPRGLVCSTKKQFEEKTVVDFLQYPKRIYPIGRLDKESEGLLLLTNQGELSDKILKGRYRHEKEYLVTVDKPVTKEFLSNMGIGVMLPEGIRTRPCRICKTGKFSFDIILTQGLNRQIRRMCEILGYHVLKLKRIRIMNLTLDGLSPGQYREITGEEEEKLRIMLAKGE